MVKAPKIPDIGPDTPLSLSMKHISETLFLDMSSFWSGSYHGDADSIHDMRVSTRRLISVLNVFGPCFKQKSFNKVFKKLRRVLKSLGKVREYDVFVALLESFGAKPGIDKALTGSLILKCRQIRAVRLEKLKRTMDKLREAGLKEEFQKFSKKPLKDNTEFIIDKPFAVNARIALQPMVEKLLGSLKDAVKDPGRIDELHDTRIMAKPLRYVSEISVPFFPDGFKACYKEIKDVLEIMGEIHDLDDALFLIEKSAKHKEMGSGGSVLEGAIKNQRDVLFQKLRVVRKKLEESGFKKRFTDVTGEKP
jgi:CHAD domain-containing protein